MTIEDLVSKISNNYHLEVPLVEAIIKQESGWNFYSIRYEPNWNYFFQIKEICSKLQITEETEEQSQKFSYGLGQMMGSVIREFGFTAYFGSFFNAEIQIHYLCKNVLKIQEKTKTLEELFACYNGGGGALLKGRPFPNQSYVDSAMSHLTYYRSQKCNLVL